MLLIHQNWLGYLPLLLLFYFNQVNCNASSKLFIEKQTQLITSGFSSVFWDHIRNLNSTTINNVSDQCSSSLNQLIQSTLNGQVWALKFLSYSGTKPNDFLDGSYTTFGSYDSCLAIDQLSEIDNNQSETNNGQSIRGKYCLTSLEPDLLKDGQYESQLLSKLYLHHFDTKHNLTIKVGLCVPSTCSQKDVQQLTSQAFNDYNWRLVDVNQCEVSTTFFDRYSSAPIGQKVFLWLFMTLIATIVWGTLIDLQSKSISGLDSKRGHIFWISQFSVYKSVRSLFRKPDETPKIIALDQLRFTCVIIVLFIHSMMWYSIINASFLVENVLKGNQLYRRIEMQPGANDWVTEGLFFVGGTSAATTLLKKVTPQTPITTYLKIIIRRAALLIPALLTVISMEVILPLFGSGPFFKSIAEYRSGVCVKNFVYNLLHIQNTCDPLEICASHTWSIAVEYQLFILLCVVIYIYKRSYRAGIAVNLFLIVFGFHQVHQVILKYNLIPHVVIVSATYKQIADRMGIYYVATQSHIWSYFFGPLMVIIMLGNYESKLGSILTKLRYNIFIVLTIVLSYTSAPWNVFGMPIEPLTTIISSIIVKLLVTFWTTLLVLPHGKRFRKFLAHSKSNDIYIYNDDETLQAGTDGQQSKVDLPVINENATGIGETSSINNNNNGNNNHEPFSTINQQSKVLSPSQLKSIHRFEIILRFYKSAYFVHSVAFASYFSTLRTSITYSIRNYLVMLFSLKAFALFSGFIFYLLIIGPIERIQYVSSKKPTKPKKF